MALSCANTPSDLVPTPGVWNVGYRNNEIPPASLSFSLASDPYYLPYSSRYSNSSPAPKLYFLRVAYLSLPTDSPKSDPSL